MNTDKLRIVEEVPGCEPHWFVAGLVPTADPPKFDTWSGAARFCETIGRDYITEYFEP